MCFFLLQLTSIVRRTMKEADKDQDSFINFDEFKEVYELEHCSMITLL